MEKMPKIFISHQSTCNEEEIEALIQYLRDQGFEVDHGMAKPADFANLINLSDFYVCVINQGSTNLKELSAEITQAVKSGKKIFGIFCPGLTVTIEIPGVLEDFATGITEWNLEKLSEALKGKDIGFSDQNGNQRKPPRATSTVGCS